MTQSGQGEEPSARHAHEGIVLPSDGGEPLLPGTTAGPGGPQHTAPPAGQAWGGSWGPQQPPSPAPGDGWGAPAQGDGWGTPPTHQAPPADQAPPAHQAPPADQWGAHPGALPPEAPPAPPYGQVDQATQYLPPVDHGTPGAPGGPLPTTDDGATQYIPHIPPAPGPGHGGPHGVDEGATQYLPPVGPGALPPEMPAGPQGGAHAAPPPAETTHYLGRVQQPAHGQPAHGHPGHGHQSGPGPMPPAGGPDAEATQYIPPVAAGAPYGQPVDDRQPPAEFAGLFRSDPGGDGPAGATQQMPRFEEPPAPYATQSSYDPPGGGRGRRAARDDDGGGRGRTGSRVPLFAAVGVAIAVVGVGAGALLGGGGGEQGDDSKTVSATAPAPQETSASPSPTVDLAEQQAVELDKLLADSGNSRAAVIKAVGDVKACTNLSQAAKDLRDAAEQRNGLITSLSGLSVDQLPQHGELTTALTEAWKASASADNHYAAWADQVAGNKKLCRKGQAKSTGQTAAGNAQSGVASEQKAKAAGLWNSIAKTYGLTERQPTQL
ncbi:hypothetical protein [Streptomyces sp. B93]|uniref:hypothetical protein n=1 Tax=Streptomyces sp. B93 TaxID=2824875 RepID=UPI001B384A44|nr:hypothetical protein [Streptomyces sp. B93]MBQ1089030.1 hypothetical protein [Streptomyces sp. B93]